MPGITLYRIDLAKNIRRYYQLDIQRDLFGNHCFIRKWGRIGHSGQSRTIPHQTEEQALAALHKQQRAKERKGYIM